MRAKKFLCLVLTTVSLGGLVGCGFDPSATDESLADLAKAARQQGYNEGYIDLAYEYGKDIPENSYSEYISARERYESDSSLENLAELVSATEQVLKDLGL